MGRCVVDFPESYRETPAFDLTPYVSNGVTRSASGQLRWREGTSAMDGFFSLDSAATKAVVGFARGQTCALGDVTLRVDSRFAAVYLTAAEREADLASSKHLLVVAMARVRQTGMKVFADTVIAEKGRAPLVMEPVKADITLRRSGTPTVYLLDHDGIRTGATLPMRDGTLAIDTARDKTPYYEIAYP